MNGNRSDVPSDLSDVAECSGGAFPFFEACVGAGHLYSQQRFLAAIISTRLRNRKR